MCLFGDLRKTQKKKKFTQQTLATEENRLKIVFKADMYDIFFLRKKINQTRDQRNFTT